MWEEVEKHSSCFELVVVLESSGYSAIVFVPDCPDMDADGNIVKAGQSIYVVSKLLGHSQVKTTARYSHLADATLLSAVDIAADALSSSKTTPQSSQPA